MDTARAIADNCNVDKGRVGSHHPLYCEGKLKLYADNSLACPHNRLPADDISTQHCIDYSIALLLIELACEETFKPGQKLSAESERVAQGILPKEVPS